MRRREVLEAAEDVGDGVGGHAGKVLAVAAELIAEPANDKVDTEMSKKGGSGVACMARTRDHATYVGHKPPDNLVGHGLGSPIQVSTQCQGIIQIDCTRSEM